MARAEPPRRRARLARILAGCGAGTLALAVWLLAPLHGGEAPKPLRVVLVDASASVTRLRPSWPAWVRRALTREGLAADESSEDLLVLLYARDVLVLAGPATASAAAEELGRRSLEVEPEGAGATDLSAGLATVLALGEGRVFSQLHLLSDRTFTGRDPEPALVRLEAQGASRAWYEPPAVELEDLALVRLDLPDEVEPGAPLGARVWLLGQGPAPGDPIGYELEIALTAPSGERRWSLSGEVAPSSGAPVAVGVDLGRAERGTTRVELRVVPSGGLGRGDAIPENDRAGGEVVAGDDLRVLVRAGDEAEPAARAWARDLGGQPGLDVSVVDEDRLAAGLATADVVVTFDADLERLPAKALASFVIRGGGWLALGGLETLASLARAPVPAAMLPLELVAPEGPERDIAILLDASGSMAGAATDEARRAARELAAAAPAGERVVLRWFTDRLEREIVVTDDPTGVLAGREPGGATDVVAALSALGDHYASVSDRRALALLVTDGRDQDFDATALADLRARLREAGVELAAFAVGPDADLAFLGELVGPQGEVRIAGEPEQLGALFRRAAAGERIRNEGPYEVSFGEDADAALASAATSPAALGRRALPAVEAYIRARTRPSALAPWAAAEGEPLLGLWRGGLGQTALFTSLPGSGAEAWARRWDATWFDPLVRSLGRTAPQDRPRLALDAGWLVLEEVPPHWPAEVLALEGSGAGGREALLLPESDALADPTDRRTGPWPWPQPRGGEIRLIDPDDPESPPLAILALPPMAPMEYAWPTRRVAYGAPGGRAAPAPRTRSEAGAPHPLAALVLGVGLALVAGAGLAWGRR